MENDLPEKNPKKPRNSSTDLSENNCLSMAADINRYGIGELEQQLAAGGLNSFSLSLALPPTESFLSHRGFEFESSGVVEGGYEIMDFQNRKQFPAQLMPDFVA